LSSGTSWSSMKSMKGLRQSSSFSDMSTSRGGAEFWSFEDGSELSGSKSLIEVLRRSWTNTPAGLGLDETLVWKACRRRCCYCVGEGPIRRTREGGSEWEPIKILLEGDEKLQQDEHGFQHTSPTHYQGCQAHVATGVPLDLGTNTPPSNPRNAAEKLNLESTDPHRSDR
jgi:hypothetical protein